MAVHQLSLGNLKYLDDERVVAAYGDALKRAIHDCEQRPGDKTGRLVILQAKLTPVMSDGHLDSVDVAFDVRDKVPDRKSKTFNMGWRKGDLLVFNDLSEDDIHQRTIDEGDDD